jgi:hypothetical protein
MGGPAAHIAPEPAVEIRPTEALRWFARLTAIGIVGVSVTRFVEHPGGPGNALWMVLSPLIALMGYCLPRSYVLTDGDDLLVQNGFRPRCLPRNEINCFGPVSLGSGSTIAVVLQTGKMVNLYAAQWHDRDERAELVACLTEWLNAPALAQ